MPTVSVVIPTRNRAKYLLEAIRSVRDQTYRDFETIVVDDGSTDNTREALSSLIDSGQVRYFLRQPKGVSAARNFGVEQAVGTLIAFLDSDDLFVPMKLEKQVKLLATQPQLGFVHCNFMKFDDAGHNLGVRDVSMFHGNVYPWMLQEWSTLMAMPCMLMRKDALQDAGGFDEHMTWAEDLDLWRRIARKHPIDLVPETLVKVRVHSASTTFTKVRAGDGFEKYLSKALFEDPALSPSFRRSAKAKMYTKLGQNLLGEGTSKDMKLVRAYSSAALKENPFQLGAGITLLSSLLPIPLRAFIVSLFRRIRYRQA